MHYFLRNRFRSSSESKMPESMLVPEITQEILVIEPEVIEPEVIETIQESIVEPEQEAVAELIQEVETRRRRCGFCREEGHRVNMCNNAQVVACKAQIQNFIINLHIIEVVDEWLYNKPALLLKAVACSYRLITFAQRPTSRYVKDIILRYILNQQARIIVRTEAQRNSNNHLHIIGTIVDNSITPTSNLPVTIYERLSITLETGNETPETVQCPICYDSVSAEKKILNCSHCLCGNCLDGVLKNSIQPNIFRSYAKCPLCRERVTVIKTA